MSWNDFDVFYSIDDDVEKIKQSAFVYNHINIYQSKLCDWVQEKNHVFNQITEWLIHNDILRVVATEEDIEDDLKDKIYSGGNRELMELIHKNKKRIANPTSYPKGYEEILAQTTKKDQEDSFLEKILLIKHRKKHEAKYWESELYRDTFTLPNIPKEIKKDISKKLEEVYQIELKYYKKNIKDFHRQYNRFLLDQFCTSYSTFIDPYELEYYEYKLNGVRDYGAIRTIKAAELILPLVNHNLINDFSFGDISEIRQNKNWNKAMKHLTTIVEKIPYSENMEDFEKQVEETIRNLLFDVIESQKGSPVKDVTKSLTSLGISFIPVCGKYIDAGMTIVDPLINYLKETTNQKNLAYFLNDLRYITK